MFERGFRAMHSNRMHESCFERGLFLFWCTRRSLVTGTLGEVLDEKFKVRVRCMELGSYSGGRHGRKLVQALRVGLPGASSRMEAG